MDIPDLPPDLAFAPLPRGDAAALAYAFGVKRAAMDPHIAARWGWDEAFQRDPHARRWAEKPFHAVALAGRGVGVLSVAARADHARSGDFCVMPETQGRGVGTCVLRHVLVVRDSRGLPVRLEHPSWNPAGALHWRRDFI